MVIGFSLYRKSAQIFFGYSESQLKHTIQLQKIKFNTYLERARQDLLFLSNSPALQEFLEETNPARKSQIRQNLETEYCSFLTAKPDYFQLRFISKQDHGKELIRTEKIGSHIIRQKDSFLQFKGDRDYFKESIILPKGSIYFSIIDLNKEYGKISQPITPTLRLASPIYHENVVAGIVVVNLDLRLLFEDLKKTAEPAEDVYLFNQQGHFLIHPDSAFCFGFEYQKSPLLHTLFSGNLDSLSQLGSINTKSHLYHLSKMHFPRLDYPIYLAVSSEKAYVLANLASWKQFSFITTVFIALLFLMIAFFWARKQTKDLHQITNSIAHFSEGKELASLPLERNDEIGILASTFHGMSQTIQKNMDALAVSKQEAVTAYQEKEAFLENMSHEIRNPLQSVLGMTNLLAQNAPRPDQLPIIETLEFSSNQLFTLVNDILDYSKLHKGNIQLHFEPVKIQQLLAQQIKSYNYYAVQKKIQLQLHCDSILETQWIETDPLRLNQIISNLLSNAIKFTPDQGHVDLFANVLNQHLDIIEIQFKVKDTGIGIPIEKQKKIFQRFHTESQEHHKMNQDGSGLGLPIVLQLLDLFQSKLSFQSQEGIGSEFQFTFMSKVKNKITQGSKSVIHKSLFPEIQRILILDDDAQSQFLYTHLLESKCPYIKTISHPDELQSIPTQDLFDLILTDFWISDLDLKHFLPKLLKHKKVNGICIAITGHHDLNAIRSQVGGQLDSILQKPIQSDGFIEKINEAYFQKHYSAPKLSTLFEDYDHHPGKINKALHLLIQEWEQASMQINSALDTQDATLIETTHHRLVNSLKKLGLLEVDNMILQLIHYCKSKQKIQDSEKIRFNLCMEEYQNIFLTNKEQLTT